jgi:hypothetical protein
MKLQNVLGALALAALAAACSGEPRTETQAAVAPEFWSVATIAADEAAPAPLQYIDAATIETRGDVRRATTVAFIALPPDTSRFGARLDIVNEFACERRQVRPISTAIAARGGAPLTNQENRAWVDIDGLANMAAPFDFVCGDAMSRAADERFARIADARPLEEIVDEIFAARAQTGQTTSD